MNDDPGALSPSEDRSWALLVGLMMWLPAELDARLATTTGLNYVDYQTLRWLSLTEDGALHMTQLAATSSVTPSHLSRIVARLEKRLMIERIPDPNDGRFTLAHLTENGARVVADSEATFGSAVRELVFTRLGPDQVQHLDAITESILSNIKPDCVSALPSAESVRG